MKNRSYDTRDNRLGSRAKGLPQQDAETETPARRLYIAAADRSLAPHIRSL